MKEFENIIGYEPIKRELLQIADCVKNKAAYEKFGARAPRGVLLHGVPGVGKTLMVKALVEACERPCFICRKDRTDGSFGEKLSETFSEAVRNEPSIIFLDDMDKFADTDSHRENFEEYVIVQAGIDKIRDENADVLVIATANGIRRLPDSLLRPGRFDRIIRVKLPNAEDNEAIVSHFLKDKPFAEDFDVKAVTQIMYGHSCAELKTVLNEAGRYAAFEKEEKISMKYFLRAALQVLFDVSPDSFGYGERAERCKKEIEKIAYHEAGHVVVRDICDEGSVVLASVYGNEYGDLGGFVTGNNMNIKDMSKKAEQEILTALAGKAALEHKFGGIDVGCTNDLDWAFECALERITDYAALGFELAGSTMMRAFLPDVSEKKKSMLETAAATEIERCYRKTREILIANWNFAELTAAALMEKKIICAKDIAEIRRKATGKQKKRA